MTDPIPFSPGGDYFDELGEYMKEGVKAEATMDKFARGLASEYTLSLLRSFAAMGSLHEEICQIINDLSGRPMGLLRYLSIDHIILLAKFYIVQWSTMTDMTAALISHGFNLGINEKDISFGLIARNGHVLKSGLKSQFERYKKELSIDKYNRQRNEIVHRGRITDKEILELKADWDKLHARRYSILQPSINDEDYETESRTLTNRNFELGKRLQERYREHYEKTTVVMKEIVHEIAKKSIDLLEKGAI